MRILFVTWDGPQVRYLESLFLPIFAGLKADDIHFDVLQFRWGEAAQTKEARRECERSGCGYRAARIHRRLGGVGPLLSAVAGARQVRKAVGEFRSDIVMPRSLMPALAVLRAGGAKLRPMVFDADGLAVDERVEFAGLSPSSLTYRLLRDVEAQAVREAASVIVRSEKAAEILHHRAGPSFDRERLHVVVNGRDAGLFQPFSEHDRRQVREELGIGASSPLLVYAGSVGNQYRFDLVAALAEEMERLDPSTRLLILTGSPELARTALEHSALSPIIMRVEPRLVPKYLAAADVGLAYRAASFSMQGVAPIKLAEYLLCGLPVVGTAAVGDTAAAAGAGLLFDEAAGPAAAARWITSEVLPKRAEYRTKAREVGLANFSLEKSLEDYRKALEPLRPRGDQGQLTVASSRGAP